MMGAVVYDLQAAGEGMVPAFSGRLMHGVFFDILHRFSPTLADEVHSFPLEKPFTVTQLLFQEKLRRGGHYRTERIIRQGDCFRWRVTGLRKEIVGAALSVRPGDVLQVHNVPMAVTAVRDDGREAGWADENELMAQCFSAGSVQSVTFHFLSPLSFRIGRDDFPWPLPQYIFYSLARKYKIASALPTLDPEQVKALAAEIPVLSWKGESRQIYLGKDTGVLGAMGKVTFDLSRFPEEEGQILLFLAKFSTFSGVGRLTAQGLGQSRVTWRILGLDGQE